MADPIVGATVQVLLEKALSLPLDRIGSVFGFKDELENLRGSVVTIQALLSDADQKQSHSKPVQLWLKKLEGVAFDADHALDELHYETLHRQVVNYRNQQLKGSKVCFFSFSYARIAFRWRMASKIRDINMKLKKINQEAQDFGLIIRHHIEAAQLPIASRVTVSRQTDSVVPPYVVGRTNDESSIVEVLLNSSDEVVPVTPIVGMGGIGKTTLAKLVYNNPKVNEHFGKKIWVCVSEKFDGIELFKLILESLTGTGVQLASRDAILQEIRKVLEGKRYLLVLDDVWNENKRLWDDFFDSLVGLIPTNGSRCLVTTRSEQVASTVSRHSPYELRKLSDDDCWSILTIKARRNGELPHALIVKKQQILKKCGGLPLAASVLGGFLGAKREEEWPSIVEKKILTIEEDGNSVKQILKLSFDNLPSPSIKKCFAYCSLFSKDTEMEKNLLIQLWMAEGFLYSDISNQLTMEDMGDQHVRVLLQASLFEEVKLYSRTWYIMHDLVHDLAESISAHKLENAEINNHGQIRYLALNSCDGLTEQIMKDMSTSVRTLFLEGKSCDMLSKFKNLYVLNLKGTDIKELPHSIGKLIHLRFLFPNRNIKTLPESICKLYCLQALRVERLREFPKGMSNLISLRHLCLDVEKWPIREFYNNIQMPLDMGQLTCLQTLPFFNVGKEKGRQIEELRRLKDLKGELAICNLELVNGKDGAEGANLFGKLNLSKLIFQWNSSNREGANCDEDVLEGLQPHPNLQELIISNFLGDKLPQWLMMNSPIALQKLVCLRLHDCKRCREVPAALGELPFLQELYFDRLPNVKTIGHSFYEITTRSGGGGQQPVAMSSRKLFPALKILELRDMENLEEWMEPAEVGVDVFPMLKELLIENCSQLVNVPSQFPSLQKLTIKRNGHVSVVKNILMKVANLSRLRIIGMVGLTCLADVTHNHHQLNNLRFLKLSTCPDLTSIRGCGSSLEELEIYDCQNLRELPEALSTIQKLSTCPIVNNVGQQSLPTMSLVNLTVSNCEELVSITLEACQSLEFLHVTRCHNLVSFPMLECLHESPRLQRIDLSNCPKLLTMPKGFASLTRLWNLDVGPFSDDSLINDQFDWSGLISSSKLISLRLYGMPHLESLPDQLQYLTSLVYLYLYNFGGMEALPNWIGNIASLRYLYLQDCQKLRCLPSEDAIRRLTKLEILHIFGCPLLKERCSPHSGPDSEWSKISHIPYVEIDAQLNISRLSA